ncbi:MAG: hypothetical protein QG602_929 [Verrucomicrobiota bacterium]|nr:hypothetical protein [Verrucomicrobiota bacterium]
MLKEHDSVVLTTDVAEDGLKAGDVGVIVLVHQDGKAFEVEFMTLAGETIAVTSLSAAQVRPVGKQDITHVRTLSVA